MAVTGFTPLSPGSPTQCLNQLSYVTTAFVVLWINSDYISDVDGVIATVLPTDGVQRCVSELCYRLDDWLCGDILCKPAYAPRCMWGVFHVLGAGSRVCLHLPLLPTVPGEQNTGTDRERLIGFLFLLLLLVCFIVVLRHSNSISVISWQFEKKKKKPEPTILLTQGILNLSRHIGMVWEELPFDNAIV